MKGRQLGRAGAHPIETESMRILAARVDLSGLPPLSRAVTARIVHSTADLGWVGDLVTDEEALRRGVRALAAGAPIVADSRMVAAGVTAAGVTAAGVTAAVTAARLTVPQASGEAAAYQGAPATRSAAGMIDAAARAGRGAVWLVGTAPTALSAVVTHAPAPALVIGLPVGFVGAVAAKNALRESGLPALSNRGERGGAAAAAAAINALLYYTDREGEST